MLKKMSGTSVSCAFIAATHSKQLHKSDNRRTFVGRKQYFQPVGKTVFGYANLRIAYLLDSEFFQFAVKSHHLSHLERIIIRSFSFIACASSALRLIQGNASPGQASRRKLQENRTGAKSHFLTVRTHTIRESVPAITVRALSGCMYLCMASSTSFLFTDIKS